MTNNTTAPALTDEQREAIEDAIKFLWNHRRVEKKETIDILRALLTSPGAAAVAGWKLVPIEPTDEMVEAGHAEYERALIGNRKDIGAAFLRRWAAMLDAAPAAPVADAEPKKVNAEARMNWAVGIVGKLPAHEPTIAIEELLNRLDDPDDREETLESIQAFADMRANQALFEVYDSPVAPVYVDTEFTESARAALAWVLYHHQGGSSPIGQPIRFALGMGKHEHLSAAQIADARRIAELCRFPAAQAVAADGEVTETDAWDDCKIAFGVDDEEGLWSAVGPGGTRIAELPKGWKLNETDCAGARCVGVFRVEGIPSSADGYVVRNIINSIEGRAAVSPATADRICTLIPLSDRHPVTDDHPRVIVFTDGSDFNGAQFFDVSADSLNECFYESPDEQPDVSRHATHWMPRPSLRHAAPATADERSTQPAGPADQAVYDAIAQNYQSGLMATAGERAAQSEPSEIEQVIACLGDDAAKLREANPDDEMADNMDAAARMLFEQGDIVERCAKIADSYKCGSCGLDGWIGAAIRASQAAAPAEAREPECPRCNGSGEAVAYTDNGPDATEETVNCPHCNGHGTLAEAYAGVVAALEKANNEYLALCGKQYFAPADAGKAVAWICSGSNDFAPIVRDRDAALRLSQAHGDGKIVALGIVPDVVSQGAQAGKGGDRADQA